MTSKEELIVDLEGSGSTGREGGVVYTRDSTSEVEGSLRYRASGGPSDLPEEGFVEVQGQGQDPIASALEQCEKWFLRPYKVLLKALGWTPFTKDGDSRALKVARLFLVLVWVAIIITTFITQALSCFRRDSFTPTAMNQTAMNQNVSLRNVSCTDHVISSYILPDLLLLSSYLFGLYLFSRDETEYLSNLAEKAFVKGVQARLKFDKKLIATVFAFIMIAPVWVVASFVVRIMTSFALDLWNESTIIFWDSNTQFTGAGKDALLVISLIGFIFFDLVYVAAVINYATQSEMNIYLLRAIRRMIIQKDHTDIDAAIKDILECRQYLRVLNGKTATATALIMFNLGSAGVLAVIQLNSLSTERAAPRLVNLATVAVGLNAVLWMGLVFFPFIQAARVSHAAQELKATGPEVRARPLQYSKTPQIELDSFVSLTQAVRLRATMFGIPVYPWLVWAIVTAFFFTALLLFQTGVYNFTQYL